MSDYKWKLKGSRYAVMNNGLVYEFTELKHAENFANNDQTGMPFARFTDQQMELEALDEGWVLWSAGDVKPKFNNGNTVIEQRADDGGQRTSAVMHLSMDKNSDIIAYRLSNAEGYKDGVKVVPEKKSLATCYCCEHEWMEPESTFYTAPCPICGDTAVTEGDIGDSTIERDDTSYKAEYDDAMREATDLALFLHKKHYKNESPEFDLCDSPAGILTQIDNMVCGLVKEGVNSLASKEWVNGLPPVGEVCEYRTPVYDWQKCKVMYVSEYNMIVEDCAGENHFDLCPTNVRFRPIQSEREKVIEKLMESLNASLQITYQSKEVQDTILYTVHAIADLGFLSIPEGFQLVPIEPTGAIIKAYFNAIQENRHDFTKEVIAYKSMLAAAKEQSK